MIQTGKPSDLTLRILRDAQPLPLSRLLASDPALSFDKNNYKSPLSPESAEKR
jgi:hypothetical protein